MSFTNWLRKLRTVVGGSETVPQQRGQHKHRPRRSLRAPTFQPRLEALEDRCLLSFSPAVSYPTGFDARAVATGAFRGAGQPVDLAAAP